MTLQETRKRILEDDEFVLSEVRKLQVLYVLKQEIRWARTRDVVEDTESVAEHVYGMFTLIEYFLPLEDSEEKWDREKIDRMALFHDIDEIETGDVLGYTKTEADRAHEREAMQRVITRLPETMRTKVIALTNEYEDQKSIESRFARAIDKMESSIHIYNDKGKEVVRANKTTYEQNKSIKDKYVEGFPYLKRFNKVIQNAMLDEGFFTPEE